MKTLTDRGKQQVLDFLRAYGSVKVAMNLSSQSVRSVWFSEIEDDPDHMIEVSRILSCDGRPHTLRLSDSDFVEAE